MSDIQFDFRDPEKYRDPIKPWSYVLTSRGMKFEGGFHKTVVMSVKQLTEMSDDDALAIQIEIEKIYEAGRKQCATNRAYLGVTKAKFKEMAKAFGSHPDKMSRGRSTGSEYAWYKNFVNEMVKGVKEHYPYEHPTHLAIKVSDLDGKVFKSSNWADFVQAVRYARHELKTYTKKKTQSNKEFIQAIQWLTENNVEFDATTDTKTLIKFATEKAREFWIDDNYPDGTEMDCSCCDECGSWNVGEHRCNCGNRRVGLSVDGGIGSFYAYAECC